MRPAVLLIALAALVACTQAPAPPASQPAEPTASTTPHAAPAETPISAPAPTPPDGDPLARTDGYGALRFGMDEVEARAAWKAPLKGDTIEPDNCAYLRPQADEEFRVGFMFEQGRFVRYDVNIESAMAPGGGRVGKTRADIERIHAGRVQVQPHKYVSGGHYLRVADPAIADGALVFETDAAGRVTRWRVGRAPQVDYVEGCS